MGGWFYRIILSLLVLFSLFFVVLYQFGGLKYFINAMIQINNLEKEIKQQAQQDFRGNDNKNVHKGLLGNSWKNKILVWTMSGPKIFTSDKYSVYSFYDICGDINSNDLIDVATSISTDIMEWNKQVKSGDYVIVQISQAENGGNIGNLREIYAYNWWGFLPIDTWRQCTR